MGENTIVFLLLALISEVLGTISGFGSSILFVPLASLFFDFKSVLSITAVFHVMSNVSKMALFRQGIDRTLAKKLGVPAIFGVVVGAAATNWVNTDVLVLVMNILLVLLSIFLLVKRDVAVAKSDRNLYIGGSISGFLAGFTGTGGAVRGITMAAFALPKNVFIATSAFIDLGVDVSRSIIYIGSGYFPAYLVWMVLRLMVASFVGTYIGMKILSCTSERLFRYLAVSFIIIASLVQIGARLFPKLTIGV